MSWTTNEGKKLSITVDGSRYDRIPLKTHVISESDDILEVVKRYGLPFMQPGDILFITEKIVACTQNRAIPLRDIKPRKLAFFLSDHVVKTSYGIGLGMPETMEMALRECGTLRILFAAACSVIGKLFHKKGWFYQIAGDKARGIDGPCSNTLPPYNQYVVLTPDKPDDVAKQIGEAFSIQVAITDINDIGGIILGAWPRLTDRKLLVKILKDNPLGQCHEQTPMGIIRKEESVCEL